MDHRNEPQFESFGLCQRLFYFIMRALAAQAVKPVTLGPSVPHNNTRKMNWSLGSDKQEAGVQDFTEDSESVASIDMEDEVRMESTCTSRGGVKAKAPRKMVSINDKPEVIDLSKKRKNGEIECRHDGELRPLRSILKVSSNLYDKSNAS
ncbi:unnamed protein product [Amaranthus hypochondriacus]